AADRESAGRFKAQVSFLGGHRAPPEFPVGALCVLGRSHRIQLLSEDVQVLKMDLKHWESYIVDEGTKVQLRGIPADATELCSDKKDARKLIKQYRKQIDELVAALAAENKRSLLVILQGVDTAGKDGAVKGVFTGVNPQHCKVVSFKEPDREEQE